LSAIVLYLDEDAAQHDLIAALRLRSVDVTSAQESGLIGASDRTQLEWCRSQGRVLYTFNVGDFYALHSELTRAGKEHSGIVLAPQQRYSVGGQLRRLLRLIRSKSAQEMVCQIEFLSAWD
jgi:hypothetical protein